MEDHLKKKTLFDRKSAVIPMIAVLFLLLIFAPVENYVTNINNYIYDIYDVLMMMVPLFLLLTIIGILISNFFCRRFSKLLLIISALLLGLLIGFYVQGTFMSFDLPQLDGREINWGNFDYQRLPSVIIFSVSLIIPVIIAVIIKDKFYRIANVISFLLLLILVITSVILLIPGDGLKNKEDMVVTDEHLFEFSDDKNLTVILLDEIGESEFEQIITDKPEYKSLLNDFTLFRNTLGSYPFTQFSIPLILTGQWYQNECSFYEFKDTAFKNSTLFNYLRENSISIGVYDEDLPTDYLAVGDFINTVKSESHLFREPFEFIKTQLKLVGLKYMPYDLKRFCIISPDYIYANSIKVLNDVTPYEWSNLSFYNRIDDSIDIVPDSIFKFVHLSGAHTPYIYDEEMNVVDSSGHDTCVKASIKMVEKYLNKLKSDGVYDNSAIVIMSDHGYYTDTRHVPLLMIKGIDEKHEFAVSDAPVSQEDLISAFEKLLEAKPAGEAFNYRDGDSRIRRYLDYDYYGEDSIIEFTQTGDALNSDTLKPTGNIYVRQGDHIYSHSFFDW